MKLKFRAFVGVKGLDTNQCVGYLSFRCCCVSLWFLNAFNVSEGSKQHMLFNSYLFYNCFINAAPITEKLLMDQIIKQLSGQLIFDDSIKRLCTTPQRSSTSFLAKKNHQVLFSDETSHMKK